MRTFAATRCFRAHFKTIGQPLRARIKPILSLLQLLGLLALAANPAWANLPGGGTSGANVTLTDNGNGTVTIANGTISIHINKTGGDIDQINYTFNNNGSSQTLNVLANGHNGGDLYWEDSGNQGLSFTYAVVADPANTGGNYAEVVLSCTTVANVLFEVHYSLLRGNTGFYVTPIWIHRSTDGAFSMGECRDNIYSGSIFNWMSVDATRNKLMAVDPSYTAVGVQGAPVECSLWTSGPYAGRYEDKYKYSADYGVQRVWGWSSVGTGGKNIGLWDVAGSVEYYPGGPMKRELMCHIGTTILNTPHGSHYGGGTDSTWATGEVWSKVCGPHFIYCNAITNAITNTITVTNAAAQALYGDALAQASAEATGWPYAWFINSYFSPASGRGTVAGQIVINDLYNPNASASNLWVGVELQPNPATTITYDFQKWYKPYQFWVKTDANGNFTIPNVIAGANYTLYAFGPGAAGTFQSQAQTGGGAPNSVDIPAAPFSVTVIAGTTNSLGTVTWTPTRVGPTVFEIGYPDRTSAKFRHGDDWWVGDIGPGATNPMPVWTKFLEYPFDFPNDVNYTVGQNRWTTDWNFIQPVVVDAAGNYNASTSTINFTLAATNNGNASLYLALSSDFQGPLIVQVNGVNLAGGSGYFPAYSSSSDESDASIREGVHGTFSDNRITFSGSLLRVGPNTITITMRKGGYFANHAMYDYVRLEMSGYMPPAPGSVSAYAGNGRNLLIWPVQPGATSYNILRSTTSGNGYVPITNGVTGPVCGSGFNNATYLDANAANGTAYYYVVQSVNPVGTSTNSPESPGVTPSGALASTAPAAPAAVTIGGGAHQSVTVNWSASAGANFYSLYRSTLYDNGGGASNVLGTIILNNNTTTTTFTDTAVTDGSTYQYFVTATSAGGTSANSMTAPARPLPAPPTGAPLSLTGSFVQVTNVVLNWSAVGNAVGYIIRFSSSSNGPFTYLQNITETTFTDVGVTPGTYYFTVTAVNAAGISAASTIGVSAPPAAPASLSAVAGNSQIILSWSPVGNATGYYLYRGTSSSNENVTVLANYSGTSYTNTGLANGTTYYYYVTATNSGGISPRSPEASATPSTIIVAGGRNLIWKGDGTANIWNLSGAANWLSNSTPLTFLNGDNVTFDNTGSNNVAVSLAGSLLPSLVTFNATKNYTFSGSGSIAGTSALIKSGSGTLTITATNLYSGGTVLSNGIIALSGPAAGGVTANNFALGAGAIDFEGGTLRLYGYNLADNSSGFGAMTNDIVVFGGQTGTINGGPRYTFGSKVTGSGTLNYFVDYVRGDINGDWTGFNGSLNIRSTSGTPTGSGADDFRVATAAGFPNAQVNVGANVFMYSRATAGAVVPLGEFSAAANVSVSAGGGSSAGTQSAVTWRVGGLNTDTTNAANFLGTTALIKEGTGIWTLTGSSTHSGTTTVSNGTLVLNGSFSSSPLIVSGGMLTGIGSAAAPVTVNSGALAPGLPTGTFTVSNNVTLSSNGTLLLAVSKSPTANGQLISSASLFCGGNLVVTNLSANPFAFGDNFQLFGAANIAGTFANIQLPDLGDATLAWNTNSLYSAGTISVVKVFTPLLAWGYDGFGQSDAPPGLTNVSTLAAGGYHSLALLSDGSLVAWGDNANGQCDVPPYLANVVAIGAGGYHSLAALSDGTVAAWGADDSGQLEVPADATNIVAVAGGESHSLALRGDGTLLAWGDNTWGQCDVPAGATNIVAIAAGVQHSLALRADGTVLAWGGNFGPLGDYTGQATVPWNFMRATAIAAGGYHSLAVQAGGTAIAWGDNSSGQLNVPANLTNAAVVGGGYAHSLARRTDGRISAWGDNLFGQGTADPTITNAIVISAGGYHNLLFLGPAPLVPLVSQAARTGAVFKAAVPTFRGRPSVLLYKNSLAETNWAFLKSLSGDGTQKTLTDSADSGPQKFYRVLIP